MNSYTFDSGKLVIKTNDLKEFVEILVKVGYQNITSLACSNNRLTSLPSELCNLTHLTEFYCFSNRLTSLPSELGNLTNITILNCSNNILTSLPSEIGNLTNLTEFYCSYNQLKSLPSEFGNCTNLIEFYCCSNLLTSLPSEIGNLTNLTILNFSDNELSSLPLKIGNLTNLTEFYSSDNRLTSIPSELGNLSNLTGFYCSANQLISLPSELGNCTNLIILNFCINRLTNLPSELGNLTNLTNLYCSDNRLTSFPSELGNLTNLTEFYYNNNPIEYIPPNVLRLIERKRISHNIYNDSQSVHDSSIQRGVKESLQRLLSEKPVLTSEKMWEYLLPRLSSESTSLLLEYSESLDIHSLLGVTFSEALLAVVSTIYSNPHEEEIFKTLNTEILDSECKCFTGRISRLVNTLNGYDDRVNIQISENDQIGTIISLLGEFEPYDSEVHKNRAIEELVSRGYPKETIEEWVNHII